MEEEEIQTCAQMGKQKWSRTPHHLKMRQNPIPVIIFAEHLRPCLEQPAPKTLTLQVGHSAQLPSVAVRAAVRSVIQSVSNAFILAKT